MLQLIARIFICTGLLALPLGCATSESTQSGDTGFDSADLSTDDSHTANDTPADESTVDTAPADTVADSQPSSFPQPVSALIILGGYILVVSNIDSLLRPRLVSKEAYLDAALVLVAALGGYDLFGFFGVVYGPVLMVLLTTTIEVYGRYYAVRRTPPGLSTGEPGQSDPGSNAPSADAPVEPSASWDEVGTT